MIFRILWDAPFMYFVYHRGGHNSYLDTFFYADGPKRMDMEIVALSKELNA